ncbi:DUF4194 domain-containing protein [Microbacterium sp. NPDC055683]
MTTPDDDPFVAATAVEDAPDDSRLSLFDGDDGALTLEQRRCLVVLIKHPIVTDDRDEWATLVRDHRLIKSRLNDLFLDLVIDRDRGVAYKVQIRSEASGYVPPLLRDATYTREETILLAFLRQRHLAERGSGLPQAHVDRDDCLSAVVPFRPARATDRAGDAKKAAAAVDSLVKTGILVKADSDDRFAISDVIETLLPLEKLRLIQQWLADQNRPENAQRRLDEGEAEPDAPEPEADEDDADEDDADGTDEEDAA